MENFEFWNPTRIVFGKGQIKELPNLIPETVKCILMTFGGGSIKKNGVYDQVKEALKGRKMIEFGGIEPNPTYETLMKAVHLGRENNVDFLLAVGGGSVLDGTKFIAAAIPYKGEDPWDLVQKTGSVKPETCVPLADVLTLPATGSEMNSGAVITQSSLKLKLPFKSDFNFPKFSILDPVTTMSLPAKQTHNGIADAFVHVCEQYLTYPQHAGVQDQFSEGLLRLLIEEAPKLNADPNDYNARANVFWASTMGLNGLIGAGVKQDWATHAIGHELTALYGVDHGATLTSIMCSVMRHEMATKKEKLLQYARRVWNVTEPDEAQAVAEGLLKTEAFFQKVLELPISVAEFANVDEAATEVKKRLNQRKEEMPDAMLGSKPLGEQGTITSDVAAEIVQMSADRKRKIEV